MTSGERATRLLVVGGCYFYIAVLLVSRPVGGSSYLRVTLKVNSPTKLISTGSNRKTVKVSGEFFLILFSVFSFSASFFT